jgi:hypothetical protein
MFFVSGFLAEVGRIFDVAEAASGAGEAACDLAILVQPDGAIRMLDASGWQLPALAVHTGAQTAYRVTRQSGHVRVEGRAGSQSCLLESETPARRAAGLLHSVPRLPIHFTPLQIAS